MQELARCPGWHNFLAFGIGVGKEAADGQQQNGAQAQAQPGGDD
jgi:hypothetical protein